MYYIKGNEERGAEVIKALVDKGGKGTCCEGTAENCYYYLDKNNNIRVTSEIMAKTAIEYLCEELTLPEKWTPEFKIGEEVDYIESDGTIANTGTVIDYLYPSRHYVVENEDGEFFWYEKFVSLHKWTPKRGETVLARNCEDWVWEEVIFSFIETYSNGSVGYHSVGGNKWNYCIPFDKNKLGKVTDE